MTILVDDAEMMTMEVATEDRFGGHYRDWRSRRVSAIVEHFGAAWFRGREVLELGCGYGDIGMAFAQLGALVTFSDGREEHLDQIREWYPSLPPDRLVRYDAETPWPFTKRFDLILHLGLLYHVDHWEGALTGAFAKADHVVLETEVCDSDDPTLVVKTVETGYDQALGGRGSRPSAACIEQHLTKLGAQFERLADGRCNANIHRYDWPVTNSGGWEHGLRRFWFVSSGTRVAIRSSHDFSETVEGWISGPSSPVQGLRTASPVATRWIASGTMEELAFPARHSLTLTVLVGTLRVQENTVECGTVLHFGPGVPIPIPIHATEHTLYLLMLNPAP